jgi:excisionase family DNA binding protein
MDDKLMTIDEAAVMMQTEADTVRSWIDRGLRTSERDDGTIMIAREDLNTFLLQEGQGQARDAAEEV